MTVALLGIDIDSSSAITAKRDLDALVPSAQKLEAAVESLSVSALQDLKRVSENGFSALVTSSRAMLAELQKVGQQRVIPQNTATDAEKAARAFEALKASIDPLYRAELQLTNAARQIDNAIKHNVITAEEGVAAMQRYADAVVNSAGRTGGGKAAIGAQIQNASYQIQDFAVQVSMGTDAVKAFGQQAPQLLSAFGPVGAVIGTVAAIGLPLLSVALGKAGDDAGSFEDRLDGAADALSALNDVIDLQKLSMDELREKYAGTTAEIESMIAAMGRVAQGNARQSVADLLRGDFSDFASQLATVESGIEQIASGISSPFDGITSGAKAAMQELGVTRDAAIDLSSAFSQLEQAGSFDQQLSALTAIRAALDAARDGTGLNDEAMAELYEQVVDVEAQVRLVAAATDTVTAGTNASVASAENLAVMWRNVQAAASAAAQAAITAMAATEDARSTAARGLDPIEILKGQDTAARAREKKLGTTEDSRLSADRGVFLDYNDRKGVERYQARLDREAAAEARKARGSKPRENDLDREIEQIQKRTAAITAATAAQAQINPLIADYGLASETAAEQARLLAAAQAAGVKVTPELEEKIRNLASAYGEAQAASTMLKDAQREAQREAENWGKLGSDATRGFITDLLDGVSAADAFASALGRIGDRLIDMAFDGIFNGTGASAGTGGLAGWLGSTIGSVLTGKRAGGGPVRAGGLYMVGERGPELFSPGANGTIIPNGAGVGGGHVFAPVINAQGADSAAIAQAMAEQRRQFDEFKATFRDNVASSNRNPRFRGAVA